MELLSPSFFVISTIVVEMIIHLSIMIPFSMPSARQGFIYRRGVLFFLEQCSDCGELDY